MTVTGASSCGLLPWWCARHRFLAAAEDLDDTHRAAAAWARFAQGEREDLCLVFRHGSRVSPPAGEQRTDPVNIHLAGRAGQQAVMPDAVEPVGQDMDQEPADKLRRRQAHDFLPVTGLDAVILPPKRDSLGVGADQAVVRDRHAVCVSAQVGQHRLRAAV